MKTKPRIMKNDELIDFIKWLFEEITEKELSIEDAEQFLMDYEDLTKHEALFI